METVIPSKFVAVPLEVRDRFIWGGSVTEDQYFRDSQFFLAVSAKMGVDDLIRKVPQLDQDLVAGRHSAADPERAARADAAPHAGAPRRDSDEAG